MLIETTNEDKVFKSLDLSNHPLVEHSFTNCTFEHCTFVNGLWGNAKFYSCTFTCCNMSFVKVDGCFLQNVAFNECKLVGIEFYKCNKTFFCVNTKQSILLNCNFSDLSMPKASFHKTQLKECYFTNTQLIEADFTDTDLQGSIFHKCKLDKADFRHAKNYALNLQANTAKKAHFSSPEVMTLLKSFDIIIDG